MIKVYKNGNLWATFEDVLTASTSIKFEPHWDAYVWEITL